MSFLVLAVCSCIFYPQGGAVLSPLNVSSIHCQQSDTIFCQFICCGEPLLSYVAIV